MNHITISIIYVSITIWWNLQYWLILKISNPFLWSLWVKDALDYIITFRKTRFKNNISFLSFKIGDTNLWVTTCMLFNIILKPCLFCHLGLLKKNLYFRHDQYWQIAYLNFLDAQNCIKKGSRNIFFFTLERYSDYIFPNLFLNNFCATKNFGLGIFLTKLYHVFYIYCLVAPYFITKK